LNALFKILKNELGMQGAILISNQALTLDVVSDEKLYHLKLFKTDDAEALISYANGSVICYLHSGNANIQNEHFSIDIVPGMYFSQKAPCHLRLSPHSTLLAVSIDDYNCLSSIGGPVEDTGRLKYIDGCSDTLLISPSRLGEPCLNLLHFPPNTKQTSHHHPSFRFGMVISGKGVSVTSGKYSNLSPGDCFFIPALLEHKFDTYDNLMNIIAFHPESDWGPTDEVHPMINRTIIP
jgi:mannose-6-phosphate isomerase-like protein (cupin superfamily)